MKKTTLTLCLFITCSFSINAQSTFVPNNQSNTTTDSTNVSVNNNTEQPSVSMNTSIYYDAIYLSKTKNYDALFAKKYGEFDSLDSLVKFYYFGGEMDKLESGNISLSSFLNTDVTYFATGISRFLADRTKAELNEAFFSGMKDKIKEYPELQVVFPQTWAIMDNNIQSYGYAYVIQLLKDAFETDMRSLPQSFSNLPNGNYNCTSIEKDKRRKNCDSIKNELKSFFETSDGQWLSFGLSVLNKTFNATNPADLLHTVTESTEINNLKTQLSVESLYDDYNIISFIELSNLVSCSFRSNEANKVWVTPQQLDTLLFKQPQAFKIYLGLLLATTKKNEIKFYKIKDEYKTFTQILSDTTKIQQFKSLVQNCHYVYNLGNNAVRNMQAAMKEAKDADPRALYDYYHSFSNTIRPLANSISTITNREIQLAKYERIEKFVNPAVDMIYHLSDKKYSSAIFDASILLSNIKFENKNDDFDKFKKSFSKYGILIANVASAQSSDEVKKAIEASALPVGSSSMKRNSQFSIFLNANVGVYGGSTFHNKGSLEYKEIKTDTTITSYIKTNSFAYGIYAPIGISFNTGFCSKKDVGALSGSLQILDVGSLVNFYMRNGDIVEYPYKVNLINILSPGLQLGYVIPKTPLQIFGSANYIPALYSKTSENNSFYGGFRFQFGLAVDIPMFKLYIHEK
jgi:hypothetical protein